MWKISSFNDEIYGPDRFEDGLDLMRQVGLRYVDLRMVDGARNFLRLDDDELDAVQRRLARYGVKVAQLGTPLFKGPLRGSQGPDWGFHHGFDDISFEDHLKLLPRAFEIADRFGVRNVRCFAFWREYKPHEVFDELVEKLSRAAEQAGRGGHGLLLENEMTTLVGTGAELARVVKAVDSPYLSGLYDWGNTGRITGTVSPEDYEGLGGGLLGHVHVKFDWIEVIGGYPTPGFSALDDTSRAWWEQTDTPLICWAQPGANISGQLQFGDKVLKVNGRRTLLTASESVAMDVRSFFQFLKDDGYDGFITIDSHYTGLADISADFRRSVEDLRNLISEVWA